MTLEVNSDGKIDTNPIDEQAAFFGALTFAARAAYMDEHFSAPVVASAYLDSATRHHPYYTNAERQYRRMEDGIARAYDPLRQALSALRASVDGHATSLIPPIALEVLEKAEL